MWRSMVMACGLALCLLGGEFMVVDRVVMADASSHVQQDALDGFSEDYLVSPQMDAFGGLPGTGKRVFVPPEWAPWVLLSVGAITVLYASALQS